MDRSQSAPEEEQYQKAAECAANMLARRPLSAAMLEKKLLEKQFCTQAVDYAVERMRLLGAVNDAAFAELVVRSYARKGCGELRIRQELRVRGVPDELIAQALQDFEPELDVMLALLDRRLHGDVSDRRDCEKAMAALQRRGFTFSQIRAAMQQYRMQAEEEQ